MINEFPVGANASPIWEGSRSLVTVNSISGLPSPDTNNLIGMLGNLQQFQFSTWITNYNGTPFKIGGDVFYNRTAVGFPSQVHWSCSVS